MNTTEIKLKHIINSFDDLYKYAMKQFLHYEKIEGIDNWKEYDFSIDCSEDQMKFKDMLQIRCIEELTEATHALDNEEHFYEEVTDALNFFLSAYCMLGVNFKDFKDPESILNIPHGAKVLAKYSLKKVLCKKEEQDLNSLVIFYASFYEIVDAIGDLCNLLKNRPWAQSNYLVSMYDFDLRLHTLWNTFWSVLARLALSKEQIFEMFERKYLVNDWRIKTGY